MTGPWALLDLAWAGAILGPAAAAWTWRVLRRKRQYRLAWAGLGLFLIAYCLGVWAFLIEPETLVVRRITVESPRWSGPPLRIGAISDTHVAAPHMDAARVRSVVDRMNREGPGVVVLLGDYVGVHQPAADRPPAERKAIMEGVAAFGSLRAPLGVVAILGNHDWWYDGPVVKRTLTGARVTVLENEAVRLDRPGGALWIAGLADSESQNAAPSPARALAAVPSNEPVIMLMHEPDAYPLVPQRVALSLAGHTHCGQVVLPIVGRLIHASPGAKRWQCGLYRDGGRPLFVTAGVGVSILPVRFRAPPEIVVITLRAPTR